MPTFKYGYDKIVLKMLKLISKMLPPGFLRKFFDN